MRAGLLSDARVIETINQKFVSTWIIIDDIQKRLGKEHFALATMLLEQHQYPLDFVFLSPEGKLITRLTSFEDLRNANPAVGHPHRDGEKSHADVFLETVKQRFGE
ncbi:MAG: hypothetical protein EXS08_04050 [Planctomycetes bacterium]|nr:hypothetical protein [Planctomycetota bacterium]